MQPPSVIRFLCTAAALLSDTICLGIVHQNMAVYMIDNCANSYVYTHI